MKHGETGGGFNFFNEQLENAAGALEANRALCIIPLFFIIIPLIFRVSSERCRVPLTESLSSASGTTIF